MSLHPQPITPVPGNRPCSPCGLSQRPSLSDVAGCPGDDLSGRGLCHLVPRVGPTGLAPVAAGVGDDHAVSGEPGDRQAAEAVRARIDWKYLLSLELTDPGFDFSVLSEFRDRLLAGSAEDLLLDKLLERCRAAGPAQSPGQQRTDSTHVLAAIRVLNRLELVAETLRAALNAVATVAPDWLQAVRPLAWYERYGKRIEESRLPKAKPTARPMPRWSGRMASSSSTPWRPPKRPEGLRELPILATLRRTWQRHYERTAVRRRPGAHAGVSGVRFKANRDLPPAAEGIESPYDADARYRHKRDTPWTGLYGACQRNLRAHRPPPAHARPHDPRHRP